MILWMSNYNFYTVNKRSNPYKQFLNSAITSIFLQDIKILKNIEEQLIRTKEDLHILWIFVLCCCCSTIKINHRKASLYTLTICVPKILCWKHWMSNAWYPDLHIFVGSHRNIFLCNVTDDLFLCLLGKLFISLTSWVHLSSLISSFKDNCQGKYTIEWTDIIFS